MKTKGAANYYVGWWRRYWFVLPTIAFVAFAAWALSWVQKDTRSGVVPLGTGQAAPPRGDSTGEGPRGDVEGPDVALPAYSPGSERRSTRRSAGATGTRLRGAKRMELKRSTTDAESGLKIPCIFRDDCEGGDTDGPGVGTVEEEGLKIPSIFEGR